MTTPGTRRQRTDDLSWQFGGEMGERVRAFDWSTTPLGAIERWPRKLVGYVSMILELPTPAIIFWGPEQTQIYNAGYATIMGPRHPRYLGAPYRECWPDTYPLIYPWMRKVLDHGETVQIDRTEIIVTRYGFTEEAYFTFTFSALRDDDGQIAGIFQPVVEVTAAVLAERRSETLRALGPKPSSGDAFVDAVAVFDGNRRDVPYCSVLLWDDGQHRLRDAASTAGAQLDAESVAIATRVFHAGTPELAAVEASSVLQSLPEAVRTLYVVPLRRSSSDRPLGVIAYGVSPRLHFDDNYRRFLELSATQIATNFDHDRLRSRAELEQRRLAHLFMEAPFLVSLMEGPEHRVTLQNPAHRAAVGGRDLVGKRLLDGMPELRGSPILHLLDRVYRTGESAIESEVPVEVVRNGRLEQAWFELVYQASHDFDGRVTGIIAAGFEITAAVQARRDLAELAKRNALAAEIGAALIAPAPPRERLQRCMEALVRGLDAAFARVWTFDADTGMLQLQASGGMYTHIDGAHASIPLGAFKIGRIAQHRLPHVRQDAVAEDPEISNQEWARQQGMVSFAGYPLLVHDTLIGVVALFAKHSLSNEAISSMEWIAYQLALGIERDRAEHLRDERDRFRELFIGMLGHDLRNPLGAITTATDTLLMRLEDQTARSVVDADDAARWAKTLGRVKASASRMARMIDQILDFTRLRVGTGIPMTRRPTNLETICRAGIDELQAAHPSRKLTVSYEGGLDGVWDPDRLAQVVSNLLGNAIAHGDPTSPVSVAVSAHGEQVFLRVHNEGARIDPELLPVIFDPFRRAQQRKTVATQGLGLGLYISRELVHAHGGTITVRSTHEHGTTFEVALPRGDD